MSLSRITAFALAGIMTLGIASGGLAQDVDPAIANLSPEEAVEARQAAMKENGGLLRGAGDLAGAEAVAASDTLIKNFTNLPHLFPENSIVGDSRATPLIWENFEEFTGYFATGLEAATAMRAAAEAGDTEAYTASIKTIGGLCGQCHEKFRGPEKS
jgi:cytochrome c556